MNKYTPGPWYAVNGTLIRGPHGEAVASTAGFAFPPDFNHAANAALIVRAVNHHEELIRAVELLEELSGEAVKFLNERMGIDEPSDITTPLEVARDAARALLAKMRVDVDSGR